MERARFTGPRLDSLLSARITPRPLLGLAPFSEDDSSWIKLSGRCTSMDSRRTTPDQAVHHRS
jgi:hypothetical protein